MSNSHTWINDKFVLSPGASLLVSDMAFQRGYGIFDFFKTINNLPVFLDDHLERFYHSAEKMRLPVGKSRHELKAIIHDLIEKNAIPDSGIRLTLTGGYAENGYEIVKPNMIITQQPLKLPSQEIVQKGIRLVTYEYQRQMADVKTINYLMAVWLQPFIQEREADDVLYHHNGIISECPRSNFFIVTGNDTIATPSRNILKGVMRMKALQVASTKFKTEERDITLEEVQAAREAFITSTTKHILPVIVCNGSAIGDGHPGKVTQWLSKELRKAVEFHLRSSQVHR